MSGLTNNKDVYRIIYWQLILVMGLALILFLLQGIRGGISALLGGLAYWLPTLVLVWRVFAQTGARAAKKFVIAFAVGEATKLFLSAFLFLLIVKYLPVNTLSVLIGFVGAVIAFWIASLILLVRNEDVV